METPLFNKRELERYSRHLIIPEFNIQGQQKLKQASVLVVGAGGLGSPLLLYLVAAGVGHIGIVDFDVVDESNLQRQVLYTMADLGKLKVEAARERLLAQNPYIRVTTHNTWLTSDNALDIIKDYDLVADGTDNFPTRYLVNDACVLLGKPNVYASIFRFDGQLSVFNYTDATGHTGPNYRDLFPVPPPPDLVPNCAEGGVLGILPGILGSLQANEVIKIITGIGEPLSGRLMLFNALTMETRIVKIFHDKTNRPQIDTLIDYQQFCGLPAAASNRDEVKEISVRELAQYIATGHDFQLIDVREPYEYDIVNIGAELIPLQSIGTAPGKIRTDKQVIIHCRSGVRSAKAILQLQQQGFHNLFNLKGGILAWIEEIDNSLPVY